MTVRPRPGASANAGGPGGRAPAHASGRGTRLTSSYREEVVRARLADLVFCHP